MNIFVLNECPFDASRDHCDRHCVKMILEYGQMLSTAHRLLDAAPITVYDDKGRKKPKKFWLFEGEQPYLNADLDEDGVWVYKWIVLNSKCYQVAHANHPCSVWVRQTDANYHWLLQLLMGCLREYTKRYGRQHNTTSILEFLSTSPRTIPRGQLTPFALAMPEEYKHDDPVEAYRRFYVGEKARFAKWKDGQVPKWFTHRMEGQNATNLSRTPAVD